MAVERWKVERKAPSVSVLKKREITMERLKLFCIRTEKAQETARAVILRLDKHAYFDFESNLSTLWVITRLFALDLTAILPSGADFFQSESEQMRTAAIIARYSKTIDYFEKTEEYHAIPIAAPARAMAAMVQIQDMISEYQDTRDVLFAEVLRRYNEYLAEDTLEPQETKV